MNERSMSHPAPTADAVIKACDLLERLGETFSPANVDYEFFNGTNRFLVLHGGVWHAITFSDTTLLIRAPADLQNEISKVIRLGR
jgi:hypothetical protein